MKTPRRRAREFTVQALYQATLTDTPVQEIINHVRESSNYNQADDKLFGTLFLGTNANQHIYMEHIRPFLGRNENSLSPIERSVLLMACHELAAMPETPYAVIINEAIEVTKTFGSTDGHKFVNSILHKLATQLRPNEPK